MAIVKIEVPQCDVCGEIWLPDKRLPDGSLNPARKHPEKCKRCGKCKTPRWNEIARKAAKEAAKKAKRETRTQPAHSAGLKGQKPGKLCKHRLLNCPVCHKE